VTARARVYTIVGVVALAAAGAIGATIAVSSGGSNPQAAESHEPPPLELDLGVRTDREAVALRRASALYRQKHVVEARAIYNRYHSVAAEVGAAMAAWPDATLERLGRLAAGNPHSALVRLNLGIALAWSGREQQALAAWREAKRAQPDSLSAVRADDLLHTRYAPGRPTFVPSFGPPPHLSRLSPQRQLAELKRGRSVRARLLYGVALQRLGKPVSAERVYTDAAALAPNDPEPQVAAAVARFDKEHPERAFSRLGPLTRRFPHAATVRFHLGLLLLWLGQVNEGKRQLRLARTVEPRTPLAREAAAFLRKLAPKA
jgi:tetratricopeptide (TPR) repeat protein